MVQIKDINGTDRFIEEIFRYQSWQNFKYVLVLSHFELNKFDSNLFLLPFFWAFLNAISTFDVMKPMRLDALKYLYYFLTLHSIENEMCIIIKFSFRFINSRTFS